MFSVLSVFTQTHQNKFIVNFYQKVLLGYFKIKVFVVRNKICVIIISLCSEYVPTTSLLSDNCICTGSCCLRFWLTKNAFLQYKLYSSLTTIYQHTIIIICIIGVVNIISNIFFSQIFISVLFVI